MSQERTVLVIEDNIANFRLIDMILRPLTVVRLLGAMQGSLDLELTQKHRPDLILLDLHLPDVLGDRLLMKMRDTPELAAVPVIILSADATRAQINRLLTQGAYPYLTKPLDVDQVLAAVQGAFTMATPAAEPVTSAGHLVGLATAPKLMATGIGAT